MNTEHVNKTILTLYMHTEYVNNTIHISRYYIHLPSMKHEA